MEAQHISNVLLEIMESWKLKSGVLTLSEDICDERIALITDIGIVRSKLGNPMTGREFDSLYDQDLNQLEIELCLLMDEVKLKYRG